MLWLVSCGIQEECGGIRNNPDLYAQRDTQMGERMHFVDAKGILSAKNGMNLYRGCTHGCIYCDSRSRCYQMNHAFEDIEVKRNAPELLESLTLEEKEMHDRNRSHVRSLYAL